MSVKQIERDIVIYSPAECARLLGLSTKTLERQRIDGTGPRFVRISRRRIAYRRSDLLRFLEQRAMSSTSEPVNE